MKKSIKYSIPVVIASIFTSAFALMPQSGLWGVSTEIDGDPGRGMQIDHQDGNVLIISYFGYRADGTATFLQAAGKIEPDDTMTADLIEYKNGMQIGGAFRKGEVQSVLGKMKLRFDSSSSGYVTFPGEQEIKISRYRFEDGLSRINNNFQIVQAPAKISTYFVAPVNGTFNATTSKLTFSLKNTTDGLGCRYSGTLVPTGASFASAGTVECDKGHSHDPDFTNYVLEDLHVDKDGFLSGVLGYSNTHSTNQNKIESIPMRLMGLCYQNGGEIDVNDVCTQRSLQTLN